LNDFVAQMDAQQAALDKADAEAKAKGLLVGRYIRHSHADSYAVYKITKQNKATVTIEHVDIGDGWKLPAWGTKTNIKIADARMFIAQRDGLANLIKSSDDWWENQAVGATLYYHSSFGQYIVGTVVVHEGKKMLMPTGMVGEWRQFDLVYRQADGTVVHGYHPKKIMAREAWQPHESTMVDHPDYRLRGAHPNTMTPLSLDPPPLDGAKEALATSLLFHKEVTTALTVTYDVDPVKHRAHVLEALNRTKALLKKWEG
jgi:hypothetical protein